MNISDSDSMERNIIHEDNKKVEKEKNESENSSFISGDEQEMDPIVESIMKNKINNDVINGNNNKSIGDKSAKNEGEKNNTTVQSLTEIQN